MEMRLFFAFSCAALGALNLLLAATITTLIVQILCLAAALFALGAAAIHLYKAIRP